MPPRRQGRVPLGRGQGREIGNSVVLEELRRLHVRMEAMEINESRNPEVSHINDEVKVQSSEDEVEETKDQIIFRMLTKASSKPKVEVLVYDGIMNVDDLMDWINSMDKYFYFGKVEDRKKVKYATTRLKGHASIWWDELQI